jgi:hypothetical protein
VRQEFRRIEAMSARERMVESLRLDEEIAATLGPRVEGSRKEGSSD